MTRLLVLNIKFPPQNCYFARSHPPQREKAVSIWVRRVALLSMQPFTFFAKKIYAGQYRALGQMRKTNGKRLPHKPFADGFMTVSVYISQHIMAMGGCQQKNTRKMHRICAET
jgi:hypothetical protein